MTREEAILLIKSAQLMLINPTTNEPVSDLYEALEMAIQALEKENIYDDKEHYVTISKALYDKLNIDYEQALSQEPQCTEHPCLGTLCRYYKEPCDDAISRILKKMWNCRGKHTTSIDKVKMEQIIRDELSVTQKSGKWIPVSEPPKELDTYLIQTDGEPYMCQCRWTDVNPFWTDIKTKPHWNVFDLPQYSKVVAWMPLPKPYEPQESEVRNDNNQNV